ncbi:TfoX/Sxy family protein [Phaeovulum sp. W22_SRMD_FR3]|uniref:TfoX/Sxy family protein n=1 Tax=Phaeovulum sp. W22_SRMD_FR3 TaxID=3240274 RepID=UPI003F9633C7
MTSARDGGTGTGGTPLTDIRNIGPATAEGLIKAGIPDAETLRALGGHEAYRRWLGAGLAPHFIGYYVLVMALQGRPWNDCGPKEKAELRRAFDALKAEVKQAPLTPDRAKEKDRLHWEAILDEIGLITPPKRRAGAGD